MINFSELLWKSSRSKGSGARRAVDVDSEDIVLSPVLQDVPTEHVILARSNPIAMLTHTHSAGADRFRHMRMLLRELRELAKLQSLVITSPMAQDGKSTIATCLATTLAEGGKNSVLLVEADLHHPTLASSLGLNRRDGLAECLQDNLDPMRYVRKIEPLGWYLLQAGNATGNPTDLLHAEAIEGLKQQLFPHFDWVLIDSPPVLPLTDALTLSRQVDATLLVARADRTPQEAIEEALNIIGKKYVVGIVLNGAETLAHRYGKYYGNYRKK